MLLCELSLSITFPVQLPSVLCFYTYRNLSIYISCRNQQFCTSEITITFPPASWNRCLSACAALLEAVITFLCIPALASQSFCQTSIKKDHRRFLKESTIASISS